jgi:hypothetical protein
MTGCEAVSADKFYESAKSWATTILYLVGWIALLVMGIRVLEGGPNMGVLIKYLIVAGLAFGTASLIRLFEAASP